MELSAKMKRFLNNKKIKWIILFLCLIGVIEIVEDVFDHEIMKMDNMVYNVISNFFISDAVTPIMKIVTSFGSAFVLICIAVFLLIFLKNKKQGIAICLNLPIIAILNQLLKHVVQRPRPTEFRIINETGYSFPSGHSMVSAAFYGLLIYYIYKNVKNKYVKWGGITLLGLLIVLIGISRIYLGVHYASDVLAGFLISISYLIIFTSVKNVEKD